MNKLKITHINTVADAGGAAKSTIRLASTQRQMGHDAQILSARPGTGCDFSHGFDKAPQADLVDQCRSQGMLYYDLQGSHQLVHHDWVQSSDVLHCSNLHGAYFNPWSLSALSHAKPLIWTLRDMQSITGHCAHSLDCVKWQTGCGNCPDLNIYPKLEIDNTAQLIRDKQYIYDNSYLQIVVPADWLRKKVQKGILRNHPVELIYNCCDTDTFKPMDRSFIRRSLNIPENAFIVGAVAQDGVLANIWKGGHYTQTVWQEVRKVVPNAIFLNIGAKGPSADPSIINVPPVQDEQVMAQLYNALDVFLYTPIADTCPLVVIETLSCGVPIVTYDTGGIPELVCNKEDGFVFPQGEIDSLVHAVMALNSHPHLARMMAQNARQSAAQRFSLNSTASQYIALYEKCIKRHQKQVSQVKYFDMNRVPDVIKTPGFLAAEKTKDACARQISAESSPGMPEVLNSQPLVSAIVSTYNSEVFIRGCLQDLVEQTLYQKGLLEIVVINSNSEQNEDAIIKEYCRTYSNIKYIKTDFREGLYAAWNRGIKASSGKYITNANTDDRHSPEMLEKLAMMLETDPDVALIYSHFYVTEIPNQTWQNKTPCRIAEWHPEFTRQALLKACLTGPQPMWRRSLHDEYGWFDESFKVAGDYEFFMRCSQTQKFKLNKEPLGLYYYNPQSLERSAGTRDREDAWVKQYYSENWEQVVRRPLISSEHQAYDQKNHDDNNDSQTSALALLMSAQREYQAGNMLTAQRLKMQYYSTVDYNQLPITFSQHRAEKPLFSVIVVTYNRPSDLKECLQSLRQQESDPYEIIIIDNGDADQKASGIIGDVDVYVDCPINFNPSEARNIAACLAKGEILVFLDDDAVPGANYLQSIRTAFEQYDIIGLRGRIFPKNNPVDSSRTTIYDLGDQPLTMACNIEGNNAYRRKAYLAVGGMDAILFGHEGLDLSYRLLHGYGRPSGLMYWPETIIYHDYGDPAKYESKKNRYLKNWQYLAYKYNYNIQPVFDRIKQVPLQQNTSGVLLPELPPMRKMTICNQPVSLPASNGPRVSIVMSCCNAAQFLSETLDSILAQTMTEWELLITDDGSTDQTRQILKGYADKDSRIRLWFFDDNKGPYVRRNFAISQSRAEFISIQDADDIMAPQKLQILYEEINRDNRLGIVGSYYRRFLDTYRGPDFGDSMEKVITHEDLMQIFPRSWHLCWHGSAIIRKSMFETIGLYDEQPYGSDTFWLSKAGLFSLLTDKVRFKNLPEYLTFKREHAQSQTGKVSPVDPRSRRYKLLQYYTAKLQQVAQMAQSNPAMDVGAALKECTCTDFIPRFGHLFNQWELAPVDDKMVQSLIQRGLAEFADQKYASALITLNYLGQFEEQLGRRFQNIDYARGLAYYAMGDDENAIKCLQCEMKTSCHRDAREFFERYLTQADHGMDAATRRDHILAFMDEIRNRTEQVPVSSNREIKARPVDNQREVLASTR